MSKKSTPARSNYKVPVKEPVDPKKASLKVIIGAVAILVVAVIIIAIVSAVTHEGLTSAKDNWVVKRAPFNDTYVYYKMGEVADIEGFVLDPDAALTFSHKLDRTVAYSPVAEDSAIDQIVFYPAYYGYELAPENSITTLSAMETSLKNSEVLYGEADGKKYTYFTYTITPETAEGEVGAMSQWLVAYVSVDSDTSIMISVNNNSETQDGFVEDAVLFETFEKALAALTIGE